MATDVIKKAIDSNIEINAGCAVVGRPLGYISRCPDFSPSLNLVEIESKYTNRFDDYDYYYDLVTGSVPSTPGFSNGFSNGFDIT